MKNYSYQEFYAIFYQIYEDIVFSTRKNITEDFRVYIRQLEENKYITHDYGEDYECFFAYGNVAVEKEGNTILHLNLPSFGWDLYDDDNCDNLNKEELEYLLGKNILQKGWWYQDNVIINANDGKIAYRTISEWEDIFFNAPCHIAYVVEYLEGITENNLTKFQEECLSKINDKFKKIKSLENLKTEMPQLLNECYELLINIDNNIKGL